ncbi:pilin [Patescibacteria group bacterium]|nr:pilin [Patescibacteria group bacterium]
MKLLKKIQIISIIILSIFIASTNIVFSQAPALQSNENMNNQTDAFRNASGFTEVAGSEGVSDIIARVIFTILSLLATVFIVLIIVAGYQWMTAGGNEEQVTKAKKNISNAVIGLIIILSAYAITWFIFTYLPMSAGTGASTGQASSGG